MNISAAMTDDDKLVIKKNHTIQHNEYTQSQTTPDGVLFRLFMGQMSDVIIILCKWHVEQYLYIDLLRKLSKPTKSYSLKELAKEPLQTCERSRKAA